MSEYQCVRVLHTEDTSVTLRIEDFHPDMAIIAQVFGSEGVLSQSAQEFVLGCAIEELIVTDRLDVQDITSQEMGHVTVSTFVEDMSLSALEPLEKLDQFDDPMHAVQVRITWKQARHAGAFQEGQTLYSHVTLDSGFTEALYSIY